MSTDELKSLLRSGLIGGVVSSLLVLAGYAQFTNPIQDLFDQIVLPVQAATVTLDAKITNFFNGISSIGTSKDENQRLRAEIVRLQAENGELSTVAEENEFLRSQVGVEERVDMDYVQARVLAFDRDVLGIGRIKIGVGEIDGVEVGRVVLSDLGVLLGRVVEVHKYTCMIEVITDPSGNLPVVVEGSETRGLLTGEVDGYLIVSSVSRDADTPTGIRVLTSGEDGKYPKGLIVGVINQEQIDPTSSFKKLVLEEQFELSSIDYVLVEAK